MIMNYGSAAYFLCIGLTVLGLAVLALVLRKFTPRVRKIVIFCIAIINLFQHVFKFIVYPQYWGTGFSYLNTAYNVCALFIILSPFAVISKRQSFKDFMCCAGFLAGLLPILFPIWYIGKTALSWGFFRFFICHLLLFYTSVLPPILKLHKLSWRSWYKHAIYFTACLAAILLDLIICIYLGLVSFGSPETLHETLYSINSFSIMHPVSAFEWILPALDAITPDLFFSGGNYVPILWYWYPLCIVIAIAGFIIGAVTDRKNFAADFRRYRENIRKFIKRKKRGGE